ncbi:MAG: indole-3-glycerol phosphate synthase TrpC [Phycisphaerae bacterium]
MAFLDDIVAHKRREVEALQVVPAPDASRGDGPPATRDFAAVLRRPGLSVIAEIKRRSPSRGLLREALDAAEVAGLYERHGAAAVSCLTDRRFFGALADDLSSARAAVSVPVLRKDFLIDQVQVHESRWMGADAVLLIVRILSSDQLLNLMAIGRSLGMHALVEVHCAAELDAALDCGAGIIGVNNRDLDSFEVNLETALRLKQRIPADVICVAESGISRREDVVALETAGFDAILLGEALVRAADPGVRLGELMGAPL